MNEVTPNAIEATPNAARPPFTPRENQVAALAARGLTNRQIGHQIGLSANSVSNVLKRVYVKAGVQSRTELAWQVASQQRSTTTQ